MATRPTPPQNPTDDRDAALRRYGLRFEGSGVKVSRSRRPGTGRMTRILRALGLTPTQHGRWCGLSLAEWLAANPGFTERDWHDLVIENYNAIHAA